MYRHFFHYSLVRSQVLYECSCPRASTHFSKEVFQGSTSWKLHSIFHYFLQGQLSNHMDFWGDKIKPYTNHTTQESEMIYTASGHMFEDQKEISLIIFLKMDHISVIVKNFKDFLSKELNLFYKTQKVSTGDTHLKIIDYLNTN